MIDEKFAEVFDDAHLGNERFLKAKRSIYLQLGSSLYGDIYRMALYSSQLDSFHRRRAYPEHFHRQRHVPLKHAHELLHRSKSLLFVIESLVDRTRRQAEDAVEPHGQPSGFLLHRVNTEYVCFLVRRIVSLIRRRRRRHRTRPAVDGGESRQRGHRYRPSERADMVRFHVVVRDVRITFALHQYEPSRFDQGHFNAVRRYSRRTTNA